MAAGETPMTENGAASVARMTPHEFRPLKPKLSRMTATAAMAAPAQSMVMSFCGGTGLTRKLRIRLTTARATTRANEYRHPIVVAKEPAMSSASTPAAGIAAAR